MSERLVIVGPGRMGLALGSALWRSGDVESVTFQGRSLEPPPHPIFDPRPGPAASAGYTMGPAPLPAGTTVLILAVPDAALAEVVHDLAAAGPAPPGCAALHVSGAISTDVLAPLHGAGYAVGSMHPLQTVADPWISADRLTGVAFAIAGDPAGLLAARRLTNALDGIPLQIPPNLRPLYHAAAVMASNYVVATIAAASRLLQQAGVDAGDADRALLPLVHGTLENLRQLGPPAALTGPIARGDIDTIRLHLGRLSPDDRALYCALGRETLRLARSVGLDPRRAEDIAELLEAG